MAKRTQREAAPHDERRAPDPPDAARSSCTHRSAADPAKPAPSDSNATESSAANAAARPGRHDSASLQPRDDAGLHSDAALLLRSMQIPTLLVDRELRLRDFTPSAAQLFRVLNSDIGRPIADISGRIDLIAVQPDIREVLDAGQPRESHLRSLDGDDWSLVRALPYRLNQDAGPVDAVVLTFTDVSELQRALEHMRACSERFTIALRHAPIALAALDRDLRYAWVYDPQLGLWPETLLGHTEAELARPALSGELDAAMQWAMRSGQGLRRELTFEARDRCTCDITIDPFYREGRFAGLTCVAVDRTEHKRAAEHQRMLMAELNHRVKNTLATVLSISAQTLPDARSVEDFRASFERRLHAMARLHDLLSRGQWARTRLLDVAEAALRPYAAARGQNVQISGPDLALRSRAALALGMVIHELATNAAKYGALSAADGHVRLAWSIEGAGAHSSLHIEWKERGGPVCNPPSTDGFGTLFIRNSVPYELGGAVDLNWHPEGLECQMRIPWREAREWPQVEAVP